MNFDKCNMGTCRFNINHICTNNEKRKECLKVSREVLADEYIEFCKWKASFKE